MPKTTTPAVAVGIKFQGILEVALVRDGVTVDKLVLSTPEGARLYSIADARRWLSNAQKATEERLTALNSAS